MRLEDDADYECQVGPVNYNRPIRAPAHLTVQGNYISKNIKWEASFVKNIALRIKIL